MREIRTLRATWRGLETGWGSGPRATPARQSSTLLMSVAPCKRVEICRLR